MRLSFFLLTNVFIFVRFRRQTLTSRRKSSPRGKNKSGSNMNADQPLDVSRDYILFSPTRLAAAIKRAKLQPSLQNQSASVLTVPTGSDLSTLSDTLPQPGKVEFIKPSLRLIFPAVVLVSLCCSLLMTHCHGWINMLDPPLVLLSSNSLCFE